MVRIPLGSGDIYMDVFKGTIPESETLETEANLLGETSGGASLEYTVETYTAESDNGKKKKTILTKENAKLKGGICTIDTGNTFSKLASTVTVTDDSANSKRTVKIGGLAKDDGKVYIVRFVQRDAQDGDLRITIVGKNAAGFILNFQKDKETVINPEFLAEPIDAEGTLIIIEEGIPKTGA